MFVNPLVSFTLLCDFSGFQAAPFVDATEKARTAAGREVCPAAHRSAGPTDSLSAIVVV